MQLEEPQTISTLPSNQFSLPSSFTPETPKKNLCYLTHFPTLPTKLSLLALLRPLKHSNTHTKTFNPHNPTATHVSTINPFPFFAATPTSLPYLLTTCVALTATAVVIADARRAAKNAKVQRRISMNAESLPWMKKEKREKVVARMIKPAEMQYKRKAAFCARRKVWMPELTASGQCKSSNVTPVCVLFNSTCSATVGLKWKNEVLLLHPVTFPPILDAGKEALGREVGV
jgi:hypothetical protein